MNESSNPFSGPVRRPDASRPEAFLIWGLAALSALLLVAASLLGMALRRERLNQAALRTQLDAALLQARTAQATGAERLEAIDKLREQMAALEREKAMAAQMARGLEDQMRAELESKDVTISKLQGKLTVNILDRILFDSGEAVLQPEGEAVLNKIAAILTQHPELKIHVIGHTDNVPIRPGARSRFASNWELSTARALAAVRYLTERAGVAPHRLGAVGYGEFRPVADNSTVEGRARNRRIAITILADELAGADTGPGAKAASSTNAPPAGAAPPPGD